MTVDPTPEESSKSHRPPNPELCKPTSLTYILFWNSTSHKSNTLDICYYAKLFTFFPSVEETQFINISSLKSIKGAGEITQQLRALSAPTEVLTWLDSQIPQVSSEQSVTPAPGESNSLCWPPQILQTHCMSVLSGKTLIYKIKINNSLKKQNKN